jgi:hypothetical protein
MTNSTPARPTQDPCRPHRYHRRDVLAGLGSMGLIALAGCSRQKTPQPVTRVEIDLSASSRARLTTTLANLDRVIDVVDREHGLMTLAGIDENSLAHDAHWVQGNFGADDGGNDLLGRQHSATARTTVTDAARRQIARTPPSQGSDVFGALTAAAQYLGDLPPGRHKRVVFLSDMVNTVGGPGLNLTAGDWNAEASRARLVQTLRGSGLLPDLHGIAVWVVGGGLATGDELSGRQMQAIRQAWLAVFAAGGASEVRFGSNLSVTA